MLTEERRRENHFEKITTEIDSEVKEAADLLYEIINHSYDCSGDCLETKIFNERMHISNLFYQCKEKLEELEKGGSKVAFLSMSVLEDTFNKCLPLLLVPLEEVADGDMSQVDAVRRLRKLFKENPYAEMWEQKAESYRNVIESLGFSVEASDYQELTAIMEPLLDALTIYQKSSASDILRVRSGSTSKKRPEIMTDVCVFHSEKEFTDAIMNCGKECVIAFGAKAPLNYMKADHMYGGINGRFEERKRNFMEHDKITAEEYDMSVCEYRQYIALGVKSAESMWLMHMPYKKDMYSNLSNPNSMYCYGKRAGYAPYQVFFKEPVSAEKDTHFLAVPRKGYRLCELMDEMQKVWLPVFLDETIHKFFPEPPEATDVFFPEEITAKADSFAIIPVGNSLQERTSLVLDIPQPEEVLSDETSIMTLIRHFGIIAENIKDYPVLPTEIGKEDKVKETFRKNVKAAYKSEVKKYATKLLEEQQDQLRNDITDELYDTQVVHVVKSAIKHRLDPFMEVKTDGMVVTTKNWRGQTEEKIWHPSVNDMRFVPRSAYKRRKSFYEYRFWHGPEANKPGVVLQIRPKTTSDYATLMGCEKDQLPELLKYYDELKECIGMPEFMNINICMRKQTYKELSKRDNKL